MLLGMSLFGFKITTQTEFQMHQCKSVLTSSNLMLKKIPIKMVLLLLLILSDKDGQILAHPHFQL